MAHERLLLLSNQLRPAEDRNFSSQTKVIPLDHNWVFKQKGGTHSETTFRSTAMFPTDIHVDLLAHNLIPDPFTGMSEKEVQWIDDKTWIYRTNFTVPHTEVTQFQSVALVFEGLDTFATVKMDGSEILRSDNMFISHRVDVRRLLKHKADHILEIAFKSATEMGQLEMKKNPGHAWGTWNGDTSRAAVRKAQYHYVSFPDDVDFMAELIEPIGLGLGT